MSRKFLDDHIELLDVRTALPGSDSRSYHIGHRMRDRIDGTVYTNEGTEKDGAIFRSALANGVDLFEDFKQRPLLNADILITATAPTLAQMALIFSANRDFEVLGTNMTGVLCTHADGGGITLTTAGADEDQGIVTPHLDASQTSWATTKWNTADRVVFETRIKTAAAITAQIVWAGLKLTNDNVVATDADQVFVRYEAGVNGGEFQLITSATGVDTTTDLNVVVAVSTEYHIKLVVNGDLDVHCYINGVQVALVQAALTTNIDLIPYVGIEASAIAAKALTVRNVHCAKDSND